MGILSGLKSALSKLGDFDRRMSYGPDYDAKARVLASLNDLKTQGTVLDNEAKFQRIQQIRAEMANSQQDRTAEGIGRAVKLGSVLPTKQDAGFVGPRLEDAGLPNTGGEGLVEDTTPLDLFGIPENARGTVMAATRQARGAREGEERYIEQKRGEEKQTADANQLLHQAQAQKALRPPAAGGGIKAAPDYYTTVEWMDENGVQHKRRMKSSEAAAMGEVVTGGSGERKDVQQLTSDIAMAKSLGDNFKPEYAGYDHNAMQGIRESAPGFMNDLGLVDAPDPEFAEWRANNKRLNNVIIKNLSGAQVTSSEYPRITGQLAIETLNPEAWLARNRAQVKALEVLHAIKTGRASAEQGRAALNQLESSLGGGGKATAPNAPSAPSGNWVEYAPGKWRER